MTLRWDRLGSDDLRPTGFFDGRQNPRKEHSRNRQLVLLHGPLPGSGVACRATLAPLPGQPGLAERTCGPLRILLAEDKPVNQLLAVKLLEKRGLTVSLASNGKDAVDAIASGAQFDLILMDVYMPEVSGYEATRQIREMEHGTGRHIPIIAMTAFALADDRQRCLATGMDNYISKPIKIRELIELVASVAGPLPVRVNG